jgi:uncharacterized membrane protein (UPF0127 family)
LLDRPSWAPSWVPSIDDVRQVRFLRWAVGLVFIAGLASCMEEGADAPADPVLGAPITSVTAAPSELAARFGSVMVQILTAGGQVLELCLLHADTPEERSRGLMEVADLEGHDGMLFANEAPVDNPFIMVDTVMPLSITWWQADGSFLSATDMTPCTEADPAACPRYPAGGAYRWAIEVPQGALADAAIGDGARLAVGEAGCTPG